MCLYNEWAWTWRWFDCKEELTNSPYFGQCIRSICWCSLLTCAIFIHRLCAWNRSNETENENRLEVNMCHLCPLRKRQCTQSMSTLEWTAISYLVIAELVFAIQPTDFSSAFLFRFFFSRFISVFVLVSLSHFKAFRRRNTSISFGQQEMHKDTHILVPTQSKEMKNRHRKNGCIDVHLEIDMYLSM